jgi:hypothetical protein
VVGTLMNFSTWRPAYLAVWSTGSPAGSVVPVAAPEDGSVSEAGVAVDVPRAVLSAVLAAAEVPGGEVAVLATPLPASLARTSPCRGRSP